MKKGFWDFQSGLLKLVYGLRNASLDLRFGAVLSGYKETSVPGMNWVVNTDYEVLSRIFVPGTIGSSDVLVDVGCGRGRVINWWLRMGCRNDIVGIEYDEPTALQTAKRLKRYTNVRIAVGDALEVSPSEGTIFYICNSFDGRIMARFNDVIKSHCLSRHSVRIVYYRALYLDVFKSDPTWNVEERELDLDLRYRDKHHTYRQYAIITPA